MQLEAQPTPKVTVEVHFWSTRQLQYLSKKPHSLWIKKYKCTARDLPSDISPTSDETLASYKEILVVSTCDTLSGKPIRQADIQVEVSFC